MPDKLSRHDPLHHIRKMCRQLEDTRDHLRRDVVKVDDPLFQQMFSEASSVLQRLITAFRAYEEAFAAKRRLQ